MVVVWPAFHDPRIDWVSRSGRPSRLRADCFAGTARELLATVEKVRTAPRHGFHARPT